MADDQRLGQLGAVASGVLREAETKLEEVTAEKVTGRWISRNNKIDVLLALGDSSVDVGVLLERGASAGMCHSLFCLWTIVVVGVLCAHGTTSVSVFLSREARCHLLHTFLFISEVAPPKENKNVPNEITAVE